MDIKITIANKRCTVQGTPVIVCGNSDYTITFTFGEEWAQAEKKIARFSYVRDGKRKKQDVEVTGNTVAVPPVYRTRELQVGVYAGDLVTSTPARIPCEKSAVCDTCTPEDLYPGPAEELRREVEALSEKGSFKLIETITLEEETNKVSVDFDKKYKAVRVRVEFPSKTTSVGYVYSKVKMRAGGQAGNMCGINMTVGTACVDLFRIASEYNPVAVFSTSTGYSNECSTPMMLSFPNPEQIAFNEKDGFAGFEVNTYAINFPAGTVIHIMGG